MTGSLLGLTNTFTFSLSPTQFRVTKHSFAQTGKCNNENISEHTEVPRHTCLLSSGNTFLKRLMRFNKRAETVQFAPVFRWGQMTWNFGNYIFRWNLYFQEGWNWFPWFWRHWHASLLIYVESTARWASWMRMRNDHPLDLDPEYQCMVVNW